MNDNLKVVRTSLRIEVHLHSGCMLVLKIWGFEKKGNRSKQRKTSLCKGQNKQQTQPMYATIDFRTQTLTLFLEGTSALTKTCTTD